MGNRRSRAVASMLAGSGGGVATLDAPVDVPVSADLTAGGGIQGPWSSDPVTQAIADGATVPGVARLRSAHPLIIEKPAVALGADGMMSAIMESYLSKDKDLGVWYVTPRFPGYGELITAKTPESVTKAPSQGSGDGDLLADLRGDWAGLPKSRLREGVQRGWLTFDFPSNTFSRTDTFPQS